jgi:hypothetical protein
MRLISSLNNTEGFALQLGDGDGQLQLENIRGFEIVLFYSTNGGISPPIALGSFLMDRLELIYPLSTNDDGTTSPTYFTLEQNYPNPFNPSTVISYQLPVSSEVTLKVYDVLGNEVATIVDEYRDAGSYDVTFNASQLASGMYVYKLQAGDFVETKKMLFMK